MTRKFRLGQSREAQDLDHREVYSHERKSDSKRRQQSAGRIQTGIEGHDSESMLHLPDATTWLHLPEAILKLRQGFGRLIRTKTDKGIIVILDNRIVTKNYGKLFLQALPKCPVVVEA